MESVQTPLSRILIFGGTTEGRTLAERLLARGFSCTVCVATPYGAEVLAPHRGLTVRTGRMDRTQMAECMRAERYAFAIDATHPFAVRASEEIAAACRLTGLPCLRLAREIGRVDGTDAVPQPKETQPQKPGPQDEEAELQKAEPRKLVSQPEKSDPQKPGLQADEPELQKPVPQPQADNAEPQREEAQPSAPAPLPGCQPAASAGIVFVDTMEEAGACLSAVPGRILATTGSRDLGAFVRALGDASRVTARVLPAGESLEACRRAGLTGRQIVAMQGPFDTQMNIAQLRHAGASWLLTKETGAAGGYPEKIEAARRCGAGVVVLRAPENVRQGVPRAQGAGTGIPLACAGSAALEGAGIYPASTGSAAPEGAGIYPASTGSADSEGTGISPACAGGAVPERAAAPAPPHDMPDGPGREAACPVPALGEHAGKRTLALVGIGVGARAARTREAEEALAGAQVLFGAVSVLEQVPEALGTTVVAVYQSGEILGYLREHPGILRAAVVYSGDSGFYSGAASMLEALREAGSRHKMGPEAECHGELSRAGSPVEKDLPEEARAREAGQLPEFAVRVVPGISCISWFAARAGLPWQDWKILSSHGRACNLIGQVRRNPQCFLLLASAQDLRRTGRLLMQAQERGQLGALRLLCGYELSRPAEEVRACTPGELAQTVREGLYVLLIENGMAERTPILPGLADSAFLRGKAPMTSSEIRALSLSRLRLPARPVLWDVGAGTGSVSVEAALACPEGTVWAVEYRQEALGLLAGNREKFCLQNMEIVEGRAPEALRELPAPTHVFIGGSGGEIGGILEAAFRKNPSARVVVNCITSETLAALHAALKDWSVTDLECVQACIHREERLGGYHYLRAANPVFIISFTGREMH